jgi:hypothetical protein
LSLLGTFEARREAVEGAAQGADLVGPVGEAGAALEVAVGDGGRRLLESPQGASDAPRQGEPQQRSARCRDEGRRDQRDHRVLLDLLDMDAGHRTRAGPATLRAPGRVVPLDEGEPAADDRRGGECHDTGGQQRHEGERRSEAEAQAHGRAAR